MVSPGGTAVVRTRKRDVEIGGDAYWAEIYGDDRDAGEDSDEE